MSPTTFLLILAALSSLYLWWGIRFLPNERWQMAAAVPVAKDPSGTWRGVNLTWYGILSANAYVAAAVLFLSLMGSVGVSPATLLVLLAAMMLLCVPASRLVARAVEGKRHTFTVGGAVFVGTLAAPFVIAIIGRLLAELPVMATLAAMTAAYALGEGLGRLACISFGCCYGKPLAASPPLVRRLFTGRAFIFSGSTRKVSYAGGLAGRELVPVQAVTAVLYSATGIAAAGLFLAGRFEAAFLLALAVTQPGRTLSELLRDDYRGGGRVSAYQIMGIIALLYGIGTAFFFRGEQAPLPEPARLIAILWTPGVILSLQLLWGAIFLYTGRSTVTGSRMTFHVNEDKI